MIVHFDESQEILRDTVRDMCANARGATRLNSDAHAALWRQCGGLGLTGVTLPESLSGSGGSLLDAGLIALELGRAGFFAGYAETVALATVLGEQAAVLRAPELLFRRVARGELALALALKLDTADPLAVASPDGEALLEDPAAPETLVIDCLAGLSAQLVALPPDCFAPRRAKSVSHRASHVLDLRTGLAEPADDVVLLRGSAAAAAWTRATTIAKCLAGAQLVGAGRQFLEMSVDYAGVRVQFGRPIGTFQAVQHALAETVAAADAAELVTFKSLAACSRGAGEDDSSVCAGLAFVREAVWTMVMKLYDVLGGVGYMEEHPFSRYVRTLLPVLAALGGAEQCEEAAAASVRKGGWL